MSHGLKHKMMVLKFYERCIDSICNSWNIKLCQHLVVCFLIDIFYFGVFSSTNCTKCGC